MTILFKAYNSLIVQGKQVVFFYIIVFINYFCLFIAWNTWFNLVAIQFLPPEAVQQIPPSIYPSERQGKQSGTNATKSSYAHDCKLVKYSFALISIR